MIRGLAIAIGLLLTMQSIISYSQTPEIDSLLNALNGHNQTDSLKAQLYLNIGIKLRRINPSDAIHYYEEAAKTAEQVNESALLVKAVNGVAICYGMMADYPMAIASFQRTISLGRKYGELGRVADGYNGLGIVYKSLGDYSQSLDYYAKALAVYDSAQDVMGTAAAYENVGVLYDLMKEPEKALSYYKQAMDIYNKEQKYIAFSGVKSNIAILYIDKEKYDEALTMLYDNTRMYDSLKRFANKVGSLNNIGHVLYKQKKYAEAEKVLNDALQQAKELDLKHEEANIYSNLFEISLATNKLQAGLDYANKYIAIAEALTSREYLASGNSMLSKIYERLGLYDKALSAYKKHKAWSDSVFNETKERAFKAQEVKVEVLEKNKQLAEQDIRLQFLEQLVLKERVLKWLLVAVSILLLGVGILFYQKFTERKKVNKLLAIKNEEISRQKEQIEIINYQLENRMLRAQINPHFIFNSLNSIQHFVTADDKYSALTYLTKFSQLLRQALESSITGNVKVEDEIKFLRMYLELESLRFDKNFSYAIDIDESLNIEDLEMPTMILQPIVENAILHGLLPKTENRVLQIDFKSNSHFIEISVDDNGIGRKASEKLQESKQRLRPSRGTAVTEQRLASLREKYGFESELTYVDKEDENGNPLGTRVVLKLAMKES